MDYELSIDPRGICRCCLAEHSALKTLFCNEIINGSILPFPKVFECVTGLKSLKDDGFPDKLCPVCRQTINDSYVLQQKCKANRTLLAGVLNIELHDDQETGGKPKVYVSAGSQTVQPDAGENRSCQTDAIEEPAAPPPIETASASAQTERTASECVFTQTAAPPARGSRQTQTIDRRPVSVVSTQTAVTTSKSTAVQTTLCESTRVIMIPAKQVLPKAEPQPEVFEQPDDDDAEKQLVEVLDSPAEAKPILIAIPSAADPQPAEEEMLFEEMLEDAGDCEAYEEYLIDELSPADAASASEEGDEELAEPEASEVIVEMREQCQQCCQEFATVELLLLHRLGNCAAAAGKRPAKRAAPSAIKPPVKRSRLAATKPISRRPQSSLTASAGGDFSITCNLCSFEARSQRDLGAHVLGHQRSLPMLLDSVYYFRCAGCNALFLTADDVDAHRDQQPVCQRLDEEAAARSAGCTDYQFLDDEWLNAECEGELDLENPALIDLGQRLCSAGPTEKGGGRMRCDRCDGFEANRVAEVWEHFGEAHFGDEKQAAKAEVDGRRGFEQSFEAIHKCGYCEKAFRTVRTAIAHVFFHANHYVCPFEGCTESYERYMNLGAHMERLHLPALSGQGFECGYCARGYEVYADYRMHLRTECEGRKHVCDVCDKRFFTKYNLQVHTKYHMNERRFKCSYCDKRFTQSGDLTIHERIHTGEKPFACPFCPKTFRSIGNRRDHVATHDTSASVSCTVCDMTFKSERILRGHMLIHAADKRFKCEVCSREFYRKYHLTKHMRQHPQEEDDGDLTMDSERS